MQRESTQRNYDTQNAQAPGRREGIRGLRRQGLHLSSDGIAPV